MPEEDSATLIDAQFHKSSVQLSFTEPSVYSSGKLSNETYMIKGFLHPSPSQELLSGSDFEPMHMGREGICGPDEASFKFHTDKQKHVSEGPDSNHSLVYIIQKDEFSVVMIGAFPTRYGIDGEWVGGASGNSYFPILISPGEHHICGEWQIKFAHHVRPLSVAKFETKPGQTYYLRARVIFASGDGQRSIELEPVTEQEGQSLLAQSLFSSAKLK